MPRPERVTVSPVPTVFDGDSAGFHATMLYRFLMIRTQAALVLITAMLCITWVFSALCSLASAYFSH